MVLVDKPDKVLKCDWGVCLQPSVMVCRMSPDGMDLSKHLILCDTHLKMFEYWHKKYKDNPDNKMV